MLDMTAAGAKQRKPGDVDVLRCLDPQCRGMLAFEVTAENILNPDLHWMARADGPMRYFPCPKCGGRNVVEEVRDAKGTVRHAVTRFVAG
jgi:ssDNA-binding Zn-finger/Zn-ribbon topoisomerase 1